MTFDFGTDDVNFFCVSGIFDEANPVAVTHFQSLYLLDDVIAAMFPPYLKQTYKNK